MSRRGSLLALLALAGFPAFVAAENLRIRNETPAILVVQTSAVVRGVLQRGRPIVLPPGDITPPITVVGNKVLTIYDAKMPNRIVGQGVIPGSATDQFYGIVAETPTRVRVLPRQLPQK